MNCHLKEAACISTRRLDTIGCMTGQPASIRYTNASLVLRSDIVGGIQVAECVKYFETTPNRF